MNLICVTSSIYLYNISELIASRRFSLLCAIFSYFFNYDWESYKRNTSVIYKNFKNLGTDSYLPFLVPRNSDSSGKAGISRYDLCDYDHVGHEVWIASSSAVWIADDRPCVSEYAPRLLFASRENASDTRANPTRTVSCQ